MNQKTNHYLDLSRLGYQGLKKLMMGDSNETLEAIVSDVNGLPADYVSPWAVEAVRKAATNVLEFRGKGGRPSLGRVPVPNTSILPETRDWLKQQQNLTKKTPGQIIDELVEVYRGDE